MKTIRTDIIPIKQQFAKIDKLNEFIKEAMRAIVSNQTLLVPVIKQMEIITNMFIAWCTFNVSLAGTVIVVRETFKVKKLTALNDEKKDNSDVIERIKP